LLCSPCSDLPSHQQILRKLKMATDIGQQFAPGFHAKLHKYLEQREDRDVQQYNHVIPIVGPLRRNASSFFSIPPELRSKVYNELVDVDVPDDPQLALWCRHKKALHPQILATCKQIYDEAISLFVDPRYVLLLSLDMGPPNGNYWNSIVVDRGLEVPDGQAFPRTLEGIRTL